MSRIGRWLAVILWASFMWFLSAQPNLNSGLPEDFILRKIAHVTEYAILTGLLVWALEPKKRQWWLLVLVIALAVGYACLDEWHQTWVVGRHGVWTDVLIDSIGVTLTLALSLFRERVRNPTSPRLRGA